jgi:ribosomal protein L35
MPKLKTNKAVSKKIKVTGRGKALRLYTRQNHFNSRETGNFGRFKKRERRLFRTDEKNALKALPYANKN